MSRHQPVAVRLMQRIAIDEGGCWVFTGHLSASGYGSIGVDGSNRRTHRVAYELFVGPIPEGLDLDHLCRNRACCNPAHLEPVTRSENIRRSPLMGTWLVKDVCKRGHTRAPENLYLKSNGNRDCKLCAKERYQEKCAALRGAA